MSTREQWEKRVLSDSESTKLKDLERSVEGRGHTYPLLGRAISATSAPMEPPDWGVRISLLEAFDEHKMLALNENVTELKFGEPSPLAKKSSLSTFLDATLVDKEAFVGVDLNLLRNIAEIRRLQQEHPEVEYWTLFTTGATGEDPERLIGETIRQLTAVLSGCHTIELRQAKGESFQSLWGRLNVSRLMAEESGLAEKSDFVSGAGFFHELEERLRD